MWWVSPVEWKVYWFRPCSIQGQVVQFLLLHRKEPGVGRELLVSVLSVNWTLTRMSLIFLQRMFEARWAVIIYAGLGSVVYLKHFTGLTHYGANSRIRGLISREQTHYGAKSLASDCWDRSFKSCGPQRKRFHCGKNRKKNTFYYFHCCLSILALLSIEIIDSLGSLSCR